MKKWILWVLGIIVVIIAAGIGGSYVWFQYTLKKSLPEIQGKMVLKGLKEEVRIVRDSFGVPHIYAANEQDLFFAFGYAVAQDRLWQMDFFRRLGQGRLSEIFGEKFIKADGYFRMLTAPGVNREVPENLVPLFDAFAKGITAYIETHSDRLPIEFRLLGYKPDPWKRDDYIAVLKVVNWGLSFGFRTDLTAGKILKRVGEERMRELFPSWPRDGALIVTEGAKAVSLAADLTREVMDTVQKLALLPNGAASNNWVVSGEKSATGKPILANDPHLGLSNPSFWWEMDLNCPTIHVSGFAVPGVPGVPIGHNRHVAWGVTNVMVDDVDFYVEKINPDNPRQYWYKDHWEDMKVIKEIIRVKGQDPVTRQILLTRHGPLIVEPQQGGGTDAVSERWAFTECLQPGKAGYFLSKARNIKEAQEALRYWELPSQNFVFADDQGNIGYWCCATVPIRSKKYGLLPVPGWTGEYEWEGYVPFEDRPHVINPAEGFVATANNRVAGSSYPYLIGNYWEPMDRITRIRALLASKEKLGINDVEGMQQDTYCPLASEFTPKLIKVLKEHPSEKGFKEAGNILSKWDFVMAEDSPAACIFEVTFRKMLDNIMKDELGDELFPLYLKTTTFPPRAVRQMIRKGSSPWFDNVNTPSKETMNDIIRQSLVQALTELEEKLGGDMKEWKWGSIHTLTFEHVLAKKRPLDLLFNIGPFPVPGNHLTINKKQYSYLEPYRASHGVSMRMIVDLSNMLSSFQVLPTGESGQLKSAHYKDQVELYLGGKYHRVDTDPDQVRKQSEGELLLIPE